MPTTESSTRTFLREDWNLDLRAELYKQELYRTRAWEKERNDWVPPWEGSTGKELADLLELKEAERATHLGSIIVEQNSDVLVGYWYDLLRFGPKTHRLTAELMHASLHVAGSVAMYFKERFQRVRPWILEPRLAPPILPRHPAYPSGTSAQVHLMAKVLAFMIPSAAEVLSNRASDVARNRERAGLHYGSDTRAGEALAVRVFKVLEGECPSFKEALHDAKANEWGADLTLYLEGLSPAGKPE